MLHIMQKSKKSEQMLSDLKCLSDAGYNMVSKTWRSMSKTIIDNAKLAKETNQFIFKNLKLGENKLVNITAKQLNVSTTSNYINCV